MQQDREDKFWSEREEKQEKHEIRINPKRRRVAPVIITGAFGPWRGGGGGTDVYYIIHVYVYAHYFADLGVCTKEFFHAC